MSGFNLLLIFCIKNIDISLCIVYNINNERIFYDVMGIGNARNSCLITRFFCQAYSRRSTYTSDAIFVSWCGLHGNDREHENANFDVAAWMTFAHGSPPTTVVGLGGTPMRATCATRFHCLSSKNMDYTAFSRCAKSPSTTNSETAGCRTACPNAQY